MPMENLSTRRRPNPLEMMEMRQMQARKRQMQEREMRLEEMLKQSQAQYYQAQTEQARRPTTMTELQRAQILKIFADIARAGKLDPLQEAQRKKTEAETGQIGKPTSLQEAQRLKIIGETGQIGKPAPKLPEDIALLEARTKLAEVQAGALPEIDKKDKLALATGLRKEFNQSKVFSNFQTVQTSERAMKRAYEASIDPKTKSKVASDQALAVLFQKMLDPTSVVRESEYARTPEGVALFNRISAYLPQLRKGGLAVTDDDRKALYDMAQKLLEEAKVSLNEHIDRYVQTATDYGVPPKLILGNIKKFDVGGKRPGLTPAEEMELKFLESLEGGR